MLLYETPSLTRKSIAAVVKLLGPSLYKYPTYVSNPIYIIVPRESNYL